MYVVCVTIFVKPEKVRQFIETTLDNASNIGLIGAGGGTETVAGFEPIPAVPEPVSIILLGTTLALAAIFIRLISPMPARKPGCAKRKTRLSTNCWALRLLWELDCLKPNSPALISM